LVFAIPSNEAILGIEEYSIDEWESLSYNTYNNAVMHEGV
jgi:hypothetical protein